MSCFPNLSNDVQNMISQIINSTDSQHIEYGTTSQTRETSLSSTLLILPQPSIVVPPSQPGFGASITVSSFTEIITTGGSTTTIVIQTAIEVAQARRPHGPFKVVLAGVVASGAVLFFLFVCIVLWLRRHRRIRSRESMKDTMLGLDSEPYTTTGVGTTATTKLMTKLMRGSRPPVIPTSRGLIPAAVCSPEAVHASSGDTPQSRSGSEEHSGPHSAPTTPLISSVIPEASFVLDDSPSGADVDPNAAPALARPQAAMAFVESKPDAERTPGDLRVQPSSPPSRPERSARDPIRETETDRSVPERTGARALRLRVEEDSGVRLAGGRLGEARGEAVESGEWEVLPPPYQEY